MINRPDVASRTATEGLIVAASADLQKAMDHEAMDDASLASAVRRYAAQGPGAPHGGRLTPHLRRLESEAIEILREVAAGFRRPVMLYSIGKDSGVMLHLARKAFFPAPLPFPLLHVDTTWKFREMIAFRDLMARALGVELLLHVNREGLARGIDRVVCGQLKLEYGTSPW